jgi:hypothetical protein
MSRGRINIEKRQVLRMETGIDGGKFQERSHEEPGAGNQHERERNLKNGERLSSQSPAAFGGGARPPLPRSECRAERKVLWILSLKNQALAGAGRSGFFERSQNAAYAVPTPIPSFLAIVGQDAPSARRQLIFAISTATRGRPTRLPFLRAAASPDRTRSANRS